MIEEIKMQELKDLFFYVFGIVPLQNYNVVGDGITDNRLGIQQAIYDAISVGARYIFVPKGNYYYSQQLFKYDEVIFIGNSTDTYIKDIDILQFPDIWGKSQKEISSLVPIGGIVNYAGLVVPTNYLECNGQTVNTSDYPILFEKLNGEVEEIPETFTVPTIANINETIKYIIRAK